MHLELRSENLYTKRCAREFLKNLIEKIFRLIAYAHLLIKIQPILPFLVVLSLQKSKFIKNWFTGTLDGVKCFQNIFGFLWFVWNPEIIFGLHNIEKSKNRFFWIRKCSKKFKKIIFQFYTRKSSYKRIFRCFPCLLVFPHAFY